VLPVVAVSLGDPAGCGPEALVGALHRGEVLRQARLVVLGDPSALRAAMRVLGVDVPLLVTADLGDLEPPAGRAVVVPVAVGAGKGAPGRPGPGCGAAAHAAFAAALELTARGGAEALCTLPVSKARVVADGIPFTGHTEVVAAACGAAGAAAVMLFVSPALRVALCTVHLPLAAVPAALTRARVARTIEVTARALADDLGVARPRIAVAGLNPHAGEEGLLGVEDAAVVAPAVADARAALGDWAEVRGPVAGDALFTTEARAGYDAAVAMYHDQGLAPLKALCRFEAVNFTAGLPIVRTSPAHGTADDVAGTGRVRPEGVEAAIVLAASVALRRRGRRARAG
jgi:4-hydroxythreonine-4-phosphate dehydrogenase